MITASTKLAAAAAFAGLVAAAYPVSAHHSTTMFDREKFIVLEGTVKELHWTNPHVAIFIENAAAKPNIPEGMWVVELTSPGNLVRSGWTRNLIKPGEKVTAEVHQLRDGTKGGGLRKITLVSSGQSFTYNIRDQERPNLEGETYK
ncbi:MAG: hypothetical protein JWN94_287 [Betaproteobacteria bacterium]|nr:hypothetical protein [Betaproteobacteria bacterium]